MDNNNKFTYDYACPSVTTDCVIFGYDGKKLKVLLILRGEKTNCEVGKWALPGGFLRAAVKDEKIGKLSPGETVEECAKRELGEETRFHCEKLEQFGVYSDPNRDSRGHVITIAHFALRPIEDVKGGDDAQEAKWFALNEIPANLAFDHRQILEDAKEKLKEKIRFEPIGFDLIKSPFTMTQLQNLYEAILDVKFDRRNFANKIKKLNILDKLDETIKNRRETFLYKFNEENYKIFKEKHNGFRLEF